MFLLMFNEAFQRVKPRHLPKRVRKLATQDLQNRGKQPGYKFAKLRHLFRIPLVRQHQHNKRCATDLKGHYNGSLRKYLSHFD